MKYYEYSNSYLITEAKELQSAANLATKNRHALHFYIFTTIYRFISKLFRSKKAEIFQTNLIQPAPPTFLPSPPWSIIMFRHLLSQKSLVALKTTAALTCLMAMLWSPNSRPFFLQYTIRAATVPLLLALGPTLGELFRFLSETKLTLRILIGGSVLAWICELAGASLGGLWACLGMVVWRGVGNTIYNM